MIERERIEEEPAVEPRTKERYRILLPLRRVTHRPGIVRFAQVLARVLEGEILVLRVYTYRDREPEEEIHVEALEDQYFQDVPFQTITYQAESVPKGISEVATNYNVDLILLNWRGRPEALRQKLSHILDPVIENAPCDIALLKGNLDTEKGKIPSEDILIATSNGTNVLASARLAFAMAKECRSHVTLMTVIPKRDEANEQKANEILDRMVEEAGLSEEEERQFVVRQIVQDVDAENAIAEAAEQHGLVFLGAPAGTVMHQLVQGTIVERLATKIESPVVVVKRYQGLPQFWMRRVFNFINEALPQVDEQARLEAYKRIRRGARGTEDYYTLMTLASIIATMGLLLNSGAIIIGAMLVAPIMGPVLAMGMGVVLGDIRLLRISALSTAMGVLLVIAVSALLSYIAPIAAVTPEIEARTRPNLFDLTVALAAGAAGAFAMSRKSIAEALPGVAIAAALLPPVSVVGISVATQRWDSASGALLLVGTNLTSIGLAAAVVYFLLGYFPQAQEQERFVHRRRSFLVILAIVFLLTLPLARTMEQEVQKTTVGQTLRTALEEALREEPGVSLSEFEWEDPPGNQPIYLRVVVFTTRDIDEQTITRINQQVSQALGREVTVQLAAIQIEQIQNTMAPDQVQR